MTTKLTRSSAAALSPEREAQNRRWEAPPLTQDERLDRIEAMGQRINGYIRFMRETSGPNGASAESKEKALIAFYDRMLVVESQLGRIQEEFKLV